MTKAEAIKKQKEIEAVLSDGVHYKVEHVKTPDLKFINIEISIKVTKE